MNKKGHGKSRAFLLYGDIYKKIFIVDG